MHIKRRGPRAMLYRSKWVAKNSRGNTHGFSEQTFVGSLPVNAVSVPESLALRLSPEERDFVEKQILSPARLAQEQARREAVVRQKDPLWRIEDAQRLLEQVAALSQDSSVPAVRLRALKEALGGIQVHPRHSPVPDQQSDPLRDAVASLEVAAKAVASGRYGRATPGSSRRSQIYENWQAIVRHVEGGTSGNESLLRALQSMGWVKTRS